LKEEEDDDDIRHVPTISVAVVYWQISYFVMERS
jgi:hypothetical protein